jgi:hypothetical protein
MMAVYSASTLFSVFASTGGGYGLSIPSNTNRKRERAEM